MRELRENPYPIRYFGYGAMKSLDMVAAVTGRGDVIGAVCSLKGFELIVQRLPDVPDVLRNVLRETWGSNYGAYRIRPKEGSYVNGVAWEISAEELELIRNWEGNGVWTTTVEGDGENPYSHEQMHIVSDAVSPEDRGHVVFDALPVFINEKEQMLAVAVSERETYLREHGQTLQRER